MLPCHTLDPKDMQVAETHPEVGGTELSRIESDGGGEEVVVPVNFYFFLRWIYLADESIQIIDSHSANG